MSLVDYVIVLSFEDTQERNKNEIIKFTWTVYATPKGNSLTHKSIWIRPERIRSLPQRLEKQLRITTDQLLKEGDLGNAVKKVCSPGEFTSLETPFTVFETIEELTSSSSHQFAEYLQTLTSDERTFTILAEQVRRKAHR